jgi:hypothetical protein
MRTHTHLAYHHVETACAADVERLCPVEQESDPMLDWILITMAARMPMPESDNIGPPLTLRDKKLMRHPPPEQVVDAFVDMMAQEQPEELPLLAQQLAEHGLQVLEQEDASEERRHLARRLTEVKTDQIMYYGVPLPFDCAKNRCLIAASQEGRVSEPCMATINQLQQVNRIEIQLEQQLGSFLGSFLGLMWVYKYCLMVWFMTLISRRYTQNKSNRRLKLRILKAVDANPSIKAQVEQDLGESVGHVPPVPAHVLPEQVATGTLTDAQACCCCCCCCSGTGCCSGDSCCCCGDAAPKGRGQGQKHVFKVKECIYEGVPIQVV